ncbi:hypothetical protein EJB05_39750, partial [Eragrostis curvula]
MEAAVGAVRWVLGKALAPVTDGLLEAWAASAGLGPNIDALKMELLYAQAMLDNTQGRELRSPALKELLLKLRQQAYKADDVLDELEYFRIQDELDGTYHAANEHAGGCIRNHALNARHTAKSVGKMLGFSSNSRSARRADRDKPDDDDATRVSCGAWPCRRGMRTRDDDEEEEEASRGPLCGAAWPCGGRASSEAANMKSPPPTNQADQEIDGGGCMGRLASGAHDTIGKHLQCCSTSSVQNGTNSNTASSRQRFLCCSRPNKTSQTEHVIKAPKLKFNRVEISERMKEIVQQLKPVCSKVSIVLNLELLDSNRCISQSIARSLDAMSSKEQGRIPLTSDSVANKSRPITTPELIESEFYGRTDETSKIIHDIVEGEYSEKDITVLPIVGPGGIGKTTLTQYIYKELQVHFEVKTWVCVSTNFNVYRLIQEIADNLKKDSNDSPEKRIEDRVQSSKFLLVLDDMWNCSDMDEWKRFLMPFKKGQKKGNVILVTTRFPAVAQIVKTTDQMVNLEGLDDDAYKKLFLACIFGDQQSANDYAGLLDTVGYKIMGRLKRSPLAAKTVGKLLRRQVDLDHWTRVLESKEWELQNDDNDIMPALKLSYDYLPFHLQQCFTYCALFPEDYKFRREELIQLWIGLDVLHSHGENRRIEDVGESYCTELVNYGFFKKDETQGESACYVIHDLLHELALKVSSHECLSIYSLNVRSIHIPPSIRHLSINIDDASVKDRATFDICLKDFDTLRKGRLKVENLHTLMIFGKYYSSFVKIFGCLFKEAKGLRVIFLSEPEASYNIGELFHQFLEFVHLRYFRVKGKATLSSYISRFYHLRVLDLKYLWKEFVLPRDMSNLVRLRHLLLPYKSMYSEIAEVGKLQSLQELKEFSVKKKPEGFELREIGQLVELSGSLCIDNLQEVIVKEDAQEASINNKRHLHRLELIWRSNGSDKDYAHEEQVLEGLKPNGNLLELCIKGHQGNTCPSWLGVNLSVENLKSLSLEGVAWQIFPPIHGLWLVNGSGEVLAGSITDPTFKNLRKLELANLPRLKRWVQNAPCYLFPHMDELKIERCSELVELSFSHSTCCQQKKEASISWFTSLQNLRIKDCPNLSSFPCIPWSRARCTASIVGIDSGLKGLDSLDLKTDSVSSEYCLRIFGKEVPGSEFSDMLAFYNLAELQLLVISGCPPLDHLQMMSSLKALRIEDSSVAFQPVQARSLGGYRFPVECFDISSCSVSGRELTELLSCFPKLSEFEISTCEKITRLSVASNVDQEQIGQHLGQQDATAEEEIAASVPEGMLLVPPQIQELCIYDNPELILVSSTIDDSEEEAGRTGKEGGWLQGLTSLRKLVIWDCPHFLSSYSSSSSSVFLFPASLQQLFLFGVEATETLGPLSNLTSLTGLMVYECGGLRGEGLWPLLAQGHLTKLSVSGSPNFFAGSKPQECSPKLQELETDAAAGVLTADFCNLLASSLTELVLEDVDVERFTKQQEDALLLLRSIQHLRFRRCNNLQFLPAGLHRLPNLKKLDIWSCKSIKSLPKDIHRSSMQELGISWSPAIRSLPKEGLPSSLRLLDVSCSDSEELLVLLAGVMSGSFVEITNLHQISPFAASDNNLHI